MLTIGTCILQPIPNGKEFTWPRRESWNKDSYLETKQDMSSNRRSLGAGSVISCTCILQDGTLENALVDIFMCQPQRQNDDVWETGANM